MKSVLAFGADAFSTAFLQSFLAHSKCVSKIGVVVPPRPCALARFADSNQLECIPAPLKTLTGWHPPSIDGWDHAIVASFGYFIPKRILQAFKFPPLNAHPSLVPRWRGPAPIQRTMLEERPDYGISIIGIDPTRFDAGLIYLQQPIEVQDGLSYAEVEWVLAEASGSAMAEVIDNWEHTYMHNGRPQDESLVTHASKVTSADAEISFHKMSGHEIYRRYLALGHQESLRGTFAGTERVVRFLDLLFPQAAPKEVSPVGSARLDRPERAVWIKAKDGSWVGVRLFRLQGKSSTFPAIPFFNDFKLRTQAFA